MVTPPQELSIIRPYSDLKIIPTLMSFLFWFRSGCMLEGSANLLPLRHSVWLRNLSKLCNHGELNKAPQFLRYIKTTQPLFVM